MGRIIFVFSVALSVAILASAFLRDGFLTKRKKVAEYAKFEWQPHESDEDLSDELLTFGEQLFFTSTGSSSGQSCAGCHDFGLGDTADQARQPYRVSLVSLGHQDWYFSDGRSDSLEMATSEMIESSQYMNSSRLRIVKAIAINASLLAQYDQIFGSWSDLLSDWLSGPGLAVADAKPARPKPDVPAWLLPDWQLYQSYEFELSDQSSMAYNQLSASIRDQIDAVYFNVLKALAVYQRHQTTGLSAFDRFLERAKTFGMYAALGDGFGQSELSGLELFLGKAKCHQCHDGPDFSDHKFHKTTIAQGRRRTLGRTEGLLLWRSHPLRCRFVSDPQRRQQWCSPISEVEWESRLRQGLGQYKTPSLRQLLTRAPYMHDGSYESLMAVIRAYNRTYADESPVGDGTKDAQGLGLNQAEMQDLEAFLFALQSRPKP